MINKYLEIDGESEGSLGNATCGMRVAMVAARPGKKPRSQEISHAYRVTATSMVDGQRYRGVRKELRDKESRVAALEPAEEEMEKDYPLPGQ